MEHETHSLEPAPLTAEAKVRAAIAELYIANARDVAEKADVSVSTARKYLKLMEEQGELKTRRCTSYSDWGRMTNVIDYAVVSREERP